MASCVSGELIPCAFVWHDPRNYPMLQKSPRRSCRIKMRNNRIGVNGFLNQLCTLIPDFKSILRARMRKIVLQHNPSKSGQVSGCLLLLLRLSA